MVLLVVVMVMSMCACMLGNFDGGDGVCAYARAVVVMVVWWCDMSTCGRANW